MVVQHKNAVGRIPNGRAKHFPWMHETVSQSANGDLVTIDRLVLCIERHDPEFFLLRFTCQSAKLMPTELDGRRRASDSGFGVVLTLQLCDSEPDLHTGHQSLYTLRSHPPTDLTDLGFASIRQFLQS